MVPGKASSLPGHSLSGGGHLSGLGVELYLFSELPSPAGTLGVRVQGDVHQASAQRLTVAPAGHTGRGAAVMQLQGLGAAFLGSGCIASLAHAEPAGT